MYMRGTACNPVLSTHVTPVLGLNICHIRFCIYMLGTKNGFAQSVDCPAQSVDPCFALAIHGMTHDCTILGLHTYDEREGPLLATLLVR